MKIASLSKTACWKLPEQDKLKEEFHSAGRFGEIRLGKEHLFYKGLFRVREIPYEQCDQIYERVSIGEYGDVPVHEHYLVVTTKQGEELVLRVNWPDDAKSAMAFLQEQVDGILYGKEKAGSIGEAK